MNVLKTVTANLRYYIAVGVMVILTVFAISTCKTCKKPELVKIDENAVIEKFYKDTVASLRKSVAILEREKDSLLKVKQQVVIKTVAAKTTISDRITRVDTAIARNDCPELMEEAASLREDFDLYVNSAEEQFEVQGKIIENQNQVIFKTGAELQIQKDLVTLKTEQHKASVAQNQSLIKDLTKTKGKMRVAKFLNKIAIPAAIIELALIILLLK